ncbi:DUF3604 domain-containing protein [Pacificimonas sp. WHA3]|uniref:DUF3604 domain-containing protein n=1 Tax=Pacificimonas pallii TaxID=2827236 RepID=A0ABS6SHF7_9SPHN|nr:DUF3604 domain-containing protein [Pacificimonas pallii]MBV7257855.1 DUF3604 domain-containing protein [Pacificimonas pallii]
MIRAILLASAVLLAACGATDGNEDVAPANASAEIRTAGYNADRNAYFGDLHIHTKNSFDAYIFNVRSTPDDVYRFARGETIRHPAGYDLSLSGPPLDFVAVTDHAAYLGILPAMDDDTTELSKLPLAQSLFSTDLTAIGAAFQTVGASVRSGIAIKGAADETVMRSTWARTVEAADRNYVPGRLTTFAGFEYTAVTTSDGDSGFGGGNLHRNVFFRGTAPDRAFATLDSTNPEDLWDWMDAERAKGHESLAIPHNSNVSDGRMFALDTYDRAPLTAAYAEQRMRNEPLVEITQVKGTSETHPSLSPNDEWANFEIYDKLLGSDTVSKTRGGFVREAYGNGLLLGEQGKGNPYRFGLIASSDTHVAGGSFDESRMWSKVGILDASPVQRGSVPPDGRKTWEGVTLDPNADNWFSRWAASGLAGVWAEENSRESIFAAMRRKETFATSGPRIKVRMFGGFDLTDDIVDAPDLTSQAYARGVPMGGDLIGDGRSSPAFLAWAVRDPGEAPLERLQIVKIWSDGPGKHERVYDAACADGAAVDSATNRCPATASTLDLADCSVSAEGGDAELKVLWRDPDFDVNQNAVYYVRVLQVPTCRWSTWDAIRNGSPPNPALPPTLQERAWTSPIWYVPRG